MFWRKFGLAEAKKADRFVKTEDQRRVVLGMAGMFNIPITITKEAKSECKRLNEASSVSTSEIIRLNKLVAKEELKHDVALRMFSDVNSSSMKWSL